MTLLLITPKTKVGELLETYPSLESVLISMSPAFAKLKNPVLRRTVARVASIQQIAAVGGLNVDEIVNRLRKEVGQLTEAGSQNQEDRSSPEYFSADVPEWFDIGKIVKTFDATPVINSGGSPMNDILSQTKDLKSGEIFELTTPFVPLPIIDMLKSKGFKVYTRSGDPNFMSYITR
jgi:hypothetical protein